MSNRCVDPDCIDVPDHHGKCTLRKLAEPADPELFARYLAVLRGEGKRYEKPQDALAEIREKLQYDLDRYEGMYKPDRWTLAGYRERLAAFDEAMRLMSEAGAR